jgi:Mn-dependent DtxR family transcriptional regulator
VVSYFKSRNKLQVYGKKIRKILGIKKDEVTEQFRTLHNEELVICTGQLVLMELW